METSIILAAALGLFGGAALYLLFDNLGGITGLGLKEYNIDRDESGRINRVEVLG